MKYLSGRTILRVSKLMCPNVQGALANCWLITAITSLANFEEVIRNLFVTKTINPEVGPNTPRNPCDDPSVQSLSP
eukprot:6220646-Pyramimonas_sp.AAC.4